MPLLFFASTRHRPESWSKEARRQYASIVFSTAVIHFPLGLAFVISGILLGKLTYYLDLTLGLALLASGILAVISTKRTCTVSINLSALMSILSGLVSIALFLATAVVTFSLKELVPANPLVWIYFIFSVSASCLESLQLYYEAKAVKQSKFRRSGSGGFNSVATSSEHGGKNVTERTEFNPPQNQKWMPLKTKGSEVAGKEESS